MRCFLLVACLAVGLSDARWFRRGRASQPKESSFVGLANNQLANAIFQGYIDDNTNIAFSPLGYSAILAILAEGARGETKEQLVSALHLPKDTDVSRKTFKYIMERLKNTHEYKYNQPELKNFFYIYKNYTIFDEYKKILEDYYLTEVRSVERYIPDHHNIDDEDLDKKTVPTSTIEVNFNDDKPSELDSIEITDLVPPKESEEKLISFAMEDKPEKVDVTPVESIDYKPAKNIKEKIKLVKTYPKKEDSGEEEETMLAVEARNHARSLKVLTEKTDISSSISVNSFGKKSTKKTPSNSLMIIFNGMYFRGAWKKPFDRVEDGLFYKSSSEKRSIPMMKSRGSFRTATLPELDSEAIEIPYDGGRYALLALVPRARDGLIRLVADLPAVSLAEIQASLTEEQLDLAIPTFYVETTTKPVAALAKFGVSSIFGPEADLTGVSPAEGLFVQELVQHVAVRVDNADTGASQLLASEVGVPQTEEQLEALKNLPLTEAKPARKFSVEHPFLFYILDRIDSLVVVAGKVTDPQQPTPFEI